MSFKTKIINRLKKVEDTKMYSVEEVVKLNLILNTKFKSDIHRIYRLIKRGELKATNMSSVEHQPRWFIEGRDIRKYIESRFIY